MQVALLSRRSAVNQFLVDLLSRGGIQAILQVSIAAFRIQARKQSPDAVILEDCGGTLAEDLGLIRSCISTHVPVLVAGSELQAGFGTALACGAVDYINLSRVGHDELKARIRGHVEAYSLEASHAIAVDGCQLDPARQCIVHGGKTVELTHRECELAWLLFSRPNQVVSSPTIVARVWGRSVESNKRTLEQHIYKLRTKLRQTGCSLRVQAAYGRGYRLLSATGEEPGPISHQQTCVHIHTPRPRAVQPMSAIPPMPPLGS
ncbi:DNA-binding response OmpR family regulator [Paracidovorax anthurii]|uniref:DNA-binding response OmpR family regulator n=1 Tax=Paracidovorax anthurii TaxID=78229 RepID=A0A328YWN5_9BURK|nr:DNA-binding response OmpR family regulator [Paracidovorax anthurii]